MSKEEAIEVLLEIAHDTRYFEEECEWEEYTEEFQKVLKESGYRHESDVIEGWEVSETVITPNVDRRKESSVLKGPSRPATLKDILEGRARKV